MDQSSQITRLVQSIKGTNRFANPLARTVVSQVTTRDLLIETGKSLSGSVLGGASTTGGPSAMALTDPSGDVYALTNIVGFANEARLF